MSEVLKFYVACSENFLSTKLAELPKYGWSQQSLNAVREVWDQIKSVEGSSNRVAVNPDALQAAIGVSIVSVYSARWWFDAFEGQCELTKPFRPYPNVPTLWSRDGQTHYLWGSTELKEALLQLWLYCDQDESRFNKAVGKVWDQYAQYSKFEAGYGGEADKLAIALKNAVGSPIA